MNTNTCTVETSTVEANNFFNDSEISFLVSNIEESKPKTNRCSQCCKESRVLNQGFHSLTDVNELYLVCDACFASTPRVLIPTILLRYYSQVRENQGIVGIN